MTLDAQQFGDAIHDVVSTAVNVYLEVNHLLVELTAELPKDVQSLVLAEPPQRDPVTKILRRWRGLLAAPGLIPGRTGVVMDDDAGEGDEEEGSQRGRKPKKLLELGRGNQILVAKVVIHSLPHRVEPHLVAGVLGGVDVSDSLLHSTAPARFQIARGGARRIVGQFDETVWQHTNGPWVSKVAVKPWGGPKARKGGLRLQFAPKAEPVRRSLFELSDRDAIRTVATQLTAYWHS